MDGGERESLGPKVPVSLSLTPKRSGGDESSGESGVPGGGLGVPEGAASDGEIEAKLLDVLESVREAIRAEGGDIVYKGIRNGVVRLQLINCETCLIPDVSVREGLERTLKARVDGIREVQTV